MQIASVRGSISVRANHATDAVLSSGGGGGGGGGALAGVPARSRIDNGDTRSIRNYREVGVPNLSPKHAVVDQLIPTRDSKSGERGSRYLNLVDTATVPS